jgi:type IV pilus assembly protein PilP
MKSASILFAVLLTVAAGASAQTPAPTPAAPPPGELVSPGQALIEQEEEALSGRAYSYDPAGRRDPFRSLLVRPEDRARGERPPGIAGMSIDDVVIHGIWRTRTGFIAQVRAVDNKSYLVRAGDLLYDGEVTRVAPNEVVFRQNINDPQSVKPFREVTKQLNVTIRP